MEHDGRSRSDEERVQSAWNLFGNPDSGRRRERVEVGRQKRGVGIQTYLVLPCDPHIDVSTTDESWNIRGWEEQSGDGSLQTKEHAGIL